MTRLLLFAALAASVAAAPAFGQGLPHLTLRGGYNPSLGTSQHGVPPQAQAEAYSAVQPDVYQQWGYTGWNGLTRHENPPAGPNSQWSSRSERYIDATPPVRGH